MSRKTRYYDVMDKDRFIELLDEYPAKNGKTSLQTLAKDINCSEMTLCKYLTEYGRELSPEIVKKIVYRTGISMDWLYGIADTKYRKDIVKTESFTVCESCPLKGIRKEVNNESAYRFKTKKCTRKVKRKLVKGQVGIDEIQKKAP